MDGIFIDGVRPRSKKQVKETAIADPRRVAIEGTSMFGSPYSGPVAEAPQGEYHFVGPDPYRDRRFYGTIAVIVGADGDREVRVK